MHDADDDTADDEPSADAHPAGRCQCGRKPGTMEPLARPMAMFQRSIIVTVVDQISLTSA